MEGRTLAQAAAIEAWEEAGVRGRIEPKETGSFSYQKVLKKGVPVPCRCSVYRLWVDELAEDWPEKHRRSRRWVLLSQAERMVEEAKEFRRPSGPGSFLSKGMRRVSNMRTDRLIRRCSASTD